MSPPTIGLTAAQIHEARRRKVRKGTHSCWECRRRKIRCQFASPDDVVCIGCRARGSSCRSQEFADETPSPSQQQQPAPEKKVAQRLDRLESMMEQLMTHVMAGPPSLQQQQQQQQQPHQQQRTMSEEGQSNTQHVHRPSSVAQSDTGDTTSSTHHSLADQTCCGDEETALDNIHKIYKDPAEIVAHVCPTAAAKQGYGMLDVLDTSTADDTPVAALLGIQDSLSGQNGGGRGSGSGSTPGASNVGVALGISANSVVGGGRSPGSMSTSINGGHSPANGPGGGNASTNGSTRGTSFDAHAPGNTSASGTSDTTAATTATKDSSSAMHFTRPYDPVSEEWRRHQHLSRLLSSLFPTQEDIGTITSGPPMQFITSLFYTKHDIASGRSEPLTRLREVPPMTSHPTVIARRLLQLTLCMQQMAPCFLLQNKLHLTEPMADVINRIAGVVSHTVTSNDELIGSIEGLECLILLGQQQSNAGQLRKAWLSYRRAMSLAQLMGLDRGNTRALKSCDPTSDPRTRPTASAIWYRINSCDRYVSLLLGLRAGCQDDDGYSIPKPLGNNSTTPNGNGEDDTDTPVEMLEKAHTILTGRIIERNHGKISLEQSYAVTQAIDADLQAAATRNLGPSWWELPSYDPYARPDFIYSEITRSIVQVHHHCILILLHLPYMLRGEHPAAAAARMMAASTSASTSMCEKSMVLPGNVDLEANAAAAAAATSDSRTPGNNAPSPIDIRRSCSGGLAYSKATCLQSSRAVLRRYVQFRLIGNTAFTCWQVDYASLIAAMTLIIGYLGPRPALGTDPSILDAFDNQLRQDRIMVEQVRERMEQIGKVNNDKLSRESAATIQQLMPILDLVAKKPEPHTASTNEGASNAGQAFTGNGEFAQDNNMRSNAGSPYPGGVGVGPGVGTPSAPTGPALRLNVPYFGTVNIHTNGATGISGVASQYGQQAESPFQQQLQPQQQQQQHQAYDLFTSTPGTQAVLDWSGSLSQVPNEPPIDLNAMLVDFDPMPMTDDGSGMGGGTIGDNGNFSSFGGGPAFPDMTGSSDDWVMQGVDTTYWSLLNGGGGSFGGQMG
ncbi:hypothetical protein SBRCBS47491_001542 [Sporothrix bragantina]|uniref:Zn(2)-C6 fungal-type domain-containing protein n=1 Tax=Sporothrix bragantina TaxID=671064 RepID=A0ABP0AZP4_9PEZI